MKKTLSVLLVIALMISLASAFAEQAPAVRLGGLKGPTTMGLVKLLSDNEEGKTLNTYDFTMAVAADELTPKLLKGELDILAVPANLGAVLYNKTEGQVQMLAASALGVLYIVEKGDSVKTLADLAGKTIFATGKGTTPEMALSYLLKENGLVLGEDVKVEWLSEPTEGVQRLNAVENGVAMLPQPFVTVAQTKVEGLRVALSLEEEWNKLANGSRLVTAAIIARKEFADNHPALVENFLKDFAASVRFVNGNSDEAARLVEKYDIVKAPIAQKALPQCNLVAITGDEMKQAVQGYLKTLFDQKPQAVGGRMPEDSFYYAAQ